MKLSALKRRARQEANFRGHILGKWTRGYGGYYNACTDCDLAVFVNPRPMSNGVAIGGEAVALTCKPIAHHHSRQDGSGGKSFDGKRSDCLLCKGG